MTTISTMTFNVPAGVQERHDQNCEQHKADLITFAVMAYAEKYGITQHQIENKREVRGVIKSIETAVSNVVHGKHPGSQITNDCLSEARKSMAKRNVIADAAYEAHLDGALPSGQDASIPGLDNF